MNDVLNEICGPEKEDNCTVADFNNQGNTNFVSDRIIRCRVKKKLVGNEVKSRPIAEKYKLKKYLEATNSLRHEFRGTYGLTPGKRTFGFIIIKNLPTVKRRAYPLTVDIKGVSGTDFKIPGFSPLLSDLTLDQDPNGRVFKPQIFRGDDRSNDTEVRMLEEVANLYWKNNPIKVNLEIFTDRETCGGCESLINNINSGTKERTGNWITIEEPVTQGVFQASTRLNPTRLAELIPLKSKYFYLRIN